MDVPSMVQRSGDTLIIRSVVSGDQIYLDKETGKIIKPSALDRFNKFHPISLERSADGMVDDGSQIEAKDEELPQCKIKRNYSCNSCTFFTQNPRYFLTHLRDVHGEKIVINECKLCLYASRHYQKLVRHMKMVHGSTEGIGDHIHARKRQLGRENRKRKSEDNMSALSFNTRIVLPPIKLEEPSQDEAPQNRLLKCSLCEFTTLYRAQLVEHEQDEHCKTKFFRCEKCSYVTHIKARFSKHVKYHSMPMIKCVTCDFRTPYKWNLDRHMKNHGGTGPFKCSACNFTADIKQSLTVHEMNHHVPPVGHAAGMSMARRKNKVGGTDLPDDFISENGDLDDPFNNNNNVDDFEEPVTKKFKYENDEQPTDLSQKSNPENSSLPKKASRPVPNLIPIQHPANALNLSTSQKELATCRNSLKDLATLFFSEGKIPEILGLDKSEPPQLSPSSSNSSTSKRKSATFFDKLKETLADDAAKNENLVCKCGYVSKCLSESIIHRNACPNDEAEDKHSSVSPINLSVNSGSTRCQYCRHRCKSSTDLAIHIQNCADAGNCQNDSLDSISDLNEKQEEDTTENEYLETAEIKHPMENKIFVWNKMPEMKANRMILMDQDSGNENEDDKRHNSHNLENGYFGVETAPGYGEVTKKMTSEEEAASSSLKKVYKCPHCSFWASTASRFHVHIVGHLNKKPFECSFCAYRSNWRWDITKHIRLKTIRDPLHKTAKVLMNDETGRRNYTKYNKYITLMKVTEEDGDPKLLKSGEMTPNQEASLAFINEYNNAMQKTKNSGESSGDCSCPNESNSQASTVGSADPKNLMRIPFMASVMGMTPHLSEQNDCNKRSPPPLIKAGDDLLTQNIDIKPDGSEKRTLYKCRKCSYKNPSRDLVLSHVKGHYQEAGIDLSQKPNLAGPPQIPVTPNIYMNNVLAAMCLSQQQQLSLTDKSGKPPSYMSTRHISIAQPPVQSTCPAQQQQNPNIITTTSVVPLNLGIPVKATEHGEMDEASSGVVTTTGSGVTGWRGPAPYRCGHCHQVSNWKHVIQRHCRLKHNGDIKIETLDRTSDKNSPKYLPLVTPFAYNSQNVLSTQTNNKNSLSIGFDGPAISITTSGDQKKDSEEERDQAKCLSETSDIHKPQKQKCPTCPYISESKSQMNYHITLHKYKPDPFECEKCNYTCSKKQSLFSHTKNFHPESAIKESDAAINLRSETSSEQDKSEQMVSFCPQCPARFLSRKELRLHIQLHGSEFAFNCKTCNFAAKQEPQLLTHALAHSTSYQDKTEQLCKKFKEDSDYPKPNLVRKTVGQSQSVWVVEGNLMQVEDVEDAIRKNVIRTEDIEHNRNSKSLNSPNSSLLTEQEQPRIGRCLNCPFESSDTEELKRHNERHLSVSVKPQQYTCDHCDFSINEESQLQEHVKIHFKFLKNSKKIEFFTSLQDLELTRVRYESSDGNKNTETLFKRDSNESRSSSSEDSPSQKIILDINSGEVISKKPAASFS